MKHGKLDTGLDASITRFGPRTMPLSSRRRKDKQMGASQRVADAPVGSDSAYNAKCAVWKWPREAFVRERPKTLLSAMASVLHMFTCLEKLLRNM